MPDYFVMELGYFHWKVPSEQKNAFRANQAMQNLKYKEYVMEKKKDVVFYVVYGFPDSLLFHKWS